MANEVVMTREGLEKLQKELDDMCNNKRREVAEKLKVARGYGDLSENAEYDAAKEEQAYVEARIRDLEATVKNARVIDDSELSGDTVSVGMHVKIQEEDGGDVEEYDIAGSTEADADAGRISDASPIGAGLIGKKTGERAEVTLPNGSVIVYQVLEVSRTKK